VTIGGVTTTRTAASTAQASGRSAGGLEVTTWSPLAAGLVCGAAASLAGAAAVIVVVIGTWLLAPHAGDDAVPLATGALAWLAAHGASITVTGLLDDTLIRFSPLGAVLLLGTAAAVGARRAARIAWCSGRNDWWRVAGATTLGYLAVAAIVLAVASQPGVAVADPRGLVGVALVAGAGALLGAAGACSDQPVTLLPPLLQLPARAAVAAFATMVAGASALLAVALLTSFGQLRAVIEEVGGTGPGILALAWLSLLSLPTLVVWVLAVAAGPGIALGPDTAVTAVAVELPSLPAFPLLTALPPAGSSPPALLLLLLPVLAGAVGGWVIHRRSPSGDEPGRLVAGLLTGLLTGATAGLACWFSVVSAGSQSLIALGPSALLVAVSLSITVGGTAAVVAWEGGRLSGRVVRDSATGTGRSVRRLLRRS
jgi:Family of unknown function (DUF6350)